MDTINSYNSFLEEVLKILEEIEKEGRKRLLGNIILYFKIFIVSVMDIVISGN